MLHKKTITYIFTFVLTLNSIAQIKKLNSVYFEALGGGIFYSLNYQRSIPLNNKVGFNTGIGFSFIYGGYVNQDSTGRYFLFPMRLNLCYKTTTHSSLELGIIFTDISSKNVDKNLPIPPPYYIFANIGYKYTFNNFFVGLAYTPLLGPKDIFYIYGAAKFGYLF